MDRRAKAKVAGARPWQGGSKVRPVEGRACSAALKSEDRRPKPESRPKSECLSPRRGCSAGRRARCREASICRPAADRSRYGVAPIVNRLFRGVALRKRAELLMRNEETENLLREVVNG